MLEKDKKKLKKLKKRLIFANNFIA